MSLGFAIFLIIMGYIVADVANNIKNNNNTRK